MYLKLRLKKYENTFRGPRNVMLLLFVFSNPLSKPEKAVYPDAIAVALDTVNHRVGQYIDFINLS